MIKYASQITIDRPVEEVFRFTSDISKFTEWTDMNESILVTEGPFGVGSQFNTGLQMGPIKVDMAFVVTTYDMNRQLAYIGTSPGPLAQWDGSFTFEHLNEASTRVSAAGELRMKGLWRLLEPLMTSEVQKTEAQELEKLKELIEALPEPEQAGSGKKGQRTLAQ